MISRRRVILGGLASICASHAGPSFGKEVRGDVVIRRRYVDCRYGQLHVHIAKPTDPTRSTKTPIMCFHPSPASGWYFRDFIADMGRDRVAMAADTPGFGESDRPPVMPEKISEFSGAMADGLEELNCQADGDCGKVDLLGYLTGCVIALDLAIERPDLIRKVILVSPPFIDDDKLRRERIKQLTYGPYTEDGTRVMKTWDGAVKRRVDGVTLEQGIKLFQERLRAGDKDWWAYKAVYTYQYAERFLMLEQPLAIFNPHGSSYEGTLKAARHTPGATLVDLPQLKNSVFSLGPDVIAREARNFLDTE